MRIGSNFVIEYNGSITKDAPGVYNHTWIKRYALELANEQWGKNISKYSNVTLQGGITLNGERIQDMAREDKLKLEEEFYNNWVMPLCIMYG